MLQHCSPYMHSRDVRQNLPHFAQMNAQRATPQVQVHTAGAQAQPPIFTQQQSQPQFAPAPALGQMSGARFGMPQ